MLRQVVPITASQFSGALAIPNTVPSKVTGADAVEYRQGIISALPEGSTFEPIMAIMLTRATTPEIVIRAAKQGVKAVKYIPKGVSTNSEESISLPELPDYYHVLDAIQSCNMVFPAHWELLCDSQGNILPEIDREKAAIHFLSTTMTAFPRLKIVAEHASTELMIEFVQCSTSENIAATLTLHHAILVYDNVFRHNGCIYNPYHYCKPIAKRINDRQAVIKAMIGGNPRIFFGSDSAPHEMRAKLKVPPAAGIFSVPVLKPGLAEIFEANGALEKMDDFMGRFGPRYYGLPIREETMELTQKDWTVPKEYNGIVPLMAGQTLHWQIAS